MRAAPAARAERNRPVTSWRDAGPHDAHDAPCQRRHAEIDDHGVRRGGKQRCRGEALAEFPQAARVARCLDAGGDHVRHRGVAGNPQHGKCQHALQQVGCAGDRRQIGGIEEQERFAFGRQVARGDHAEAAAVIGSGGDDQVVARRPCAGRSATAAWRRPCRPRRGRRGCGTDRMPRSATDRADRSVCSPCSARMVSIAGPPFCRKISGCAVTQAVKWITGLAGFSVAGAWSGCAARGFHPQCEAPQRPRHRRGGARTMGHSHEHDDARDGGARRPARWIGGITACG